MFVNYDEAEKRFFVQIFINTWTFLRQFCQNKNFVKVKIKKISKIFCQNNSRKKYTSLIFVDFVLNITNLISYANFVTNITELPTSCTFASKLIKETEMDLDEKRNSFLIKVLKQKLSVKVISLSVTQT